MSTVSSEPLELIVQSGERCDHPDLWAEGIENDQGARCDLITCVACGASLRMWLSGGSRPEHRLGA